MRIGVRSHASRPASIRLYHSAPFAGSVHDVEYAWAKFLRTFSTALRNLFCRMGFSKF